MSAGVNRHQNNIKRYTTPGSAPGNFSELEKLPERYQLQFAKIDNNTQHMCVTKTHLTI